MQEQVAEELLTAKLSQLLAEEQELLKLVTILLKSAQREAVCEALRELRAQSDTHQTQLHVVSDLLDNSVVAESPANVMAGLRHEANYLVTEYDAGRDIDALLLATIHKAISLMATDYSYATHLTYSSHTEAEAKKEVLDILNQCYQDLTQLNHRFAQLAQQALHDTHKNNSGAITSTDTTAEPPPKEQAVY